MMHAPRTNMADVPNPDVEQLRLRVKAALPSMDVSRLRNRGGRWYGVTAEGHEYELSAVLHDYPAMLARMGR